MKRLYINQNRALLVSLLTCLLVFVQTATASSSTEKHQIDIVVAYTHEAGVWANQNAFDCEYLMEQHEEEKDGFVTTAAQAIKAAEVVSVAKANSFSDSLTDERAEELRFTHICNQTEPELDETRGIDQLIEIANQELNQIYINSGIDNVNFNIKKIVPMGAYSEFDIRYGKHPEGLYRSKNLFFNPPVYTELRRLRERTHYDFCEFDGTNNDYALYGWSPEICKQNASSVEDLHQIRLQEKADLLIVLTVPPSEVLDDTNVTGIGEAAGVGIEAAQNGIAWVSIKHATAPSYTYAHEISHLMGANHYSLNEILGNVIQPNVLNPDLGIVDNFGYIGEISPYLDLRPEYYPNETGAEEYRTLSALKSALDEFTHYGTLMSESGQCAKYFIEMNASESNGCSNEGKFTDRFLVLPVLSYSSNAISRAIPLGSNYRKRENARSVKNTVERVSLLSNQLDRIKSVKQVREKMGIDFGFTESYSGASVNTPDKRNIKNESGQVLVEETWLNLTSVSKGTFDTGSSGLAVEIIESFGSRKYAEIPVQASIASELGEMPVTARMDSFTTTWKKQTWFDRQPSAIKLSGLDSQACYSLRIFSSSNAVDNVRTTHINLWEDNYDYYKAVQKRKQSLSARPRPAESDHYKYHGSSANYNYYIEFSNLEAKNGSLILEIMADESMGTFDTVALNALQVFEDPNPSCH